MATISPDQRPDKGNVPSSLLEAALYYHRLGWSIIPLHPGTKSPIYKDWSKYCTQRSTEEEIQTWWSRWPNANVGMTLGPATGLIAVDVDSEEGTELLAEWAGGPENISPTLTFSTPGGGYRLLYRWPEGIEARTRSFKGKNRKEIVRIMGLGSQTVMPPSRIDYREYIWGEASGIRLFGEEQ